MRLVVDLQACETGSRHRGIGRYAMNLIQAIAPLLEAADELVIAIDMANADSARDVRKELRQRSVSAKVVAYGYPWTPHTDKEPAAQQIAGQLRSRFFASLCPDVLLICSLFETGEPYCTELDWAVLRGIPTAVVGYDVIPLLFPYRYLLAGGFPADWYRDRLEDLLKFDLILSISHATKRDLMARLSIPDDRIVVIGAGFDETLIPPPDTVQARCRLLDLGIDRPFVLMVGNGDWRKNTLGALHAFADLPVALRDAHQLVLTQAGDDVRHALEHDNAGLRDRVRILGRVDDATLALLYRECKVFYFPSYYEGFGLPVLEAMAFDAVVLSSSAGSLPEVVPDPRALFDPAVHEEAVALLSRALSDSDFRDELRCGAREHAFSFAWSKSARLALEPLRALCERRKRKLPSVVGAAPTWPSTQDISLMADAVLEVQGVGQRALASGISAVAWAGKRRMLVDITEMIRLDAGTGIHRVTGRFLQELSSLARKSDAFEVEPFHAAPQGIVYGREFARTRLGLPSPGPDELLEVQPSDLVLMLDATWASPERFDDLHARTRAVGGEVVWMMYDLVPIRFPETCNPLVPPAFEMWLRHAVSAADGFVCISETTRSDLEGFMDSMLGSGSARPWTRSVQLGSDMGSISSDQVSEAAMKLRAEIGGRQYFTALGTVEPRKSYKTIVDAFELLWANGVDVALVIMGKQGWNVDTLVGRINAHPERGRRLFWLQSATDGDVRCLLEGSASLIQASLSEGFGLPLVEAGSLGVPLLVSDIPVFHEVAGSSATYFPAGDAEALAAAITATVQGKAVGNTEVIAFRSWEEAARELVDVLCVA